MKKKKIAHSESINREESSMIQQLFANFTDFQQNNRMFIKKTDHLKNIICEKSLYFDNWGKK